MNEGDDDDDEKKEKEEGRVMGNLCCKGGGME